MFRATRTTRLEEEERSDLNIVICTRWCNSNGVSDHEKYVCVFLEAQRQRFYLTQILYAGGSKESKMRKRGTARRDISMQKKGRTEKETQTLFS